MLSSRGAFYLSLPSVSLEKGRDTVSFQCLSCGVTASCFYAFVVVSRVSEFGSRSPGASHRHQQGTDACAEAEG